MGSRSTPVQIRCSCRSQRPSPCATSSGLSARLVPTLPPRTAYILRGGTLYPLPQASVLGIPTRLLPLVSNGLLSAPAKLRVMMDLVLPRRTSADTDDESIGSFFRRRFGAEAVTYVAEPLLAGIHSGNVERLSMRALFPRLLEAEREHGSVIRGLRRAGRAGRAGRAAAGEGPFRSLLGGIGGARGCARSGPTGRWASLQLACPGGRGEPW